MASVGLPVPLTRTSDLYSHQEQLVCVTGIKFEEILLPFPFDIMTMHDVEYHRIAL